MKGLDGEETKKKSIKMLLKEEKHFQKIIRERKIGFYNLADFLGATIQEIEFERNTSPRTLRLLQWGELADEWN